MADVLLERYTDLQARLSWDRIQCKRRKSSPLLVVLQALSSLYPALSRHFDFYANNAAAHGGLVQWENYGDW